MSAFIEASLPCGNGGERYKHLLSAATVYMSLNLMRMFLVALDSHRELVEDVSNIVRLQGSFNKLALMTFIYFGGDLLNRLIPIEFVTTLAGVIAAIAKYLCIFSCSSCFTTSTS